MSSRSLRKRGHQSPSSSSHAVSSSAADGRPRKLARKAVKDGHDAQHSASSSSSSGPVVAVAVASSSSSSSTVVKRSPSQWHQRLMSVHWLDTLPIEVLGMMADYLTNPLIILSSQSNVSNDGKCVTYKPDLSETYGGGSPQESIGSLVADLPSTEWSMRFVGKHWKMGIYGYVAAMHVPIVYCLRAGDLIRRKETVVTVRCDLASDTMTFVVNGVLYGPFTDLPEARDCRVFVELNPNGEYEASLEPTAQETAEIIDTPPTAKPTTTATPEQLRSVVYRLKPTKEDNPPYYPALFYSYLPLLPKAPN